MARDELAELAEAFSKAVSNRDVEAIAEMYAEDARLLPPNMPMMQGRDTVRTVFEFLFASGLKSSEFETVDVIEEGGLIVEVGQYINRTESPGGEMTADHGKYKVAYRRAADGHLEIAVDMMSSDQPAPQV